MTASALCQSDGSWSNECEEGLSELVWWFQIWCARMVLCSNWVAGMCLNGWVDWSFLESIGGSSCCTSNVPKSKQLLERSKTSPISLERSAFERSTKQNVVMFSIPNFTVIILVMDTTTSIPCCFQKVQRWMKALGKKHVRNHMFCAPPSSGFLEFPGPTAADRESKSAVP